MRILVSAGPTREFFDSVRFISNPSSGKFGYALAREAARRGHEVTLVSGPVALAAPKAVRCVPVVSAAEMSTACKNAFRRADVAIMTAAVCDHRPVHRIALKMPKKTRAFALRFEPTEDIAAALGKIKGKRLLVGFAMEDHDAYEHAERKLRRKNCDLIVLNGPGNVGSDAAVIELYSPATGWSKPIRGSKTAVARRLIRWIETAYAASADRKRSAKKPYDSRSRS